MRPGLSSASVSNWSVRSMPDRASASKNTFPHRVGARTLDRAVHATEQIARQAGDAVPEIAAPHQNRA